MIARAVVAFAIAGCGGNPAVPVDAAPPLDAAAGPCTATFSGNFADGSTASGCAQISEDTPGHAVLALAIPVTTLAMSLPVQIDLGASPSPGFYSSETVATWSARVGVTVGVGACIYNAGTNAVPHGSFQLELGAVDLAGDVVHGSLELTLYVLASPGTSCGDGETETVAVRF